MVRGDIVYCLFMCVCVCVCVCACVRVRAGHAARGHTVNEIDVHVKIKICPPVFFTGHLFTQPKELYVLDGGTDPPREGSVNFEGGMPDDTPT